MTPELILTDSPADCDQALLSDGLTEFNIQKIGYSDRHKVAALVRDPETGNTLGGMIGKTSYGLLFIDLVYLPENLRGQDTGRRLLAMMEEEGIKRGCKTGFLYTITFQAPGFYERHGWTEFGRIPCDPPGTARVFFTKTLSLPTVPLSET